MLSSHRGQSKSGEEKSGVAAPSSSRHTQQECRGALLRKMRWHRRRTAAQPWSIEARLAQYAQSAQGRVAASVSGLQLMLEAVHLDAAWSEAGLDR